MSCETVIQFYLYSLANIHNWMHELNIPKKNFCRLISLKCLNLCGEASIWITVQFCDSFLCVLSSYTDSDYVKLYRYNLEDFYRRHICNCKYIQNKVHAEFVGAFMIYIYTKFHTCGSNGTLGLGRPGHVATNFRCDFFLSSF